MAQVVLAAQDRVLDHLEPGRAASLAGVCGPASPASRQACPVVEHVGGGPLGQGMNRQGGIHGATGRKQA
jgi:hypothetical protein